MLLIHINVKNKSMATKSIEFTVNNSSTFTSYLKKFISIDKSTLLEIDLDKSKFISKSSNEERSVVKYSSLSFSEANFDLKTKSKIRIKIGIYNISRLIKIIDQFIGEFQFIVKYDEVINNNQTEYAGTSIILSNTGLKFANECTSLSIFKYISDELYETKIHKIDNLVSFEFNKETIEKIRTFCDLDKEYKLIEFINKNGNLYVKGKSFEYLILSSSDNNIRIPFYKDQFDKLDSENYNLIIGSDRVLFTSLDTSTEITISKVEANDNYEETVTDQF